LLKQSFEEKKSKMQTQEVVEDLLHYLGATCQRGGYEVYTKVIENGMVWN
jgi:hypothetical protein